MEKRFPMDDESLSSAGVARRVAMLEVLKREVSRRKARRAFIRRGVLAASLSVGILVLAGRFAPRPPDSGGLVEAPLPAPPRAVTPPPLEHRLKSVRFEVVRVKPDLTERWRVRAKPRVVKLLTDDDLLRELAAADVPSGLIRVPDGYILTADVTRPARRG